MIELRALKNFLAVAECLNISSAANLVNLSQPALSRQIQALERKLDTQLFERVGKRLVLTAEGADLARDALELVERAEDLIQPRLGGEAKQTGTLRIGASPQTIIWLLSPAMARFREIFPKVELIVSEGHNDALINMVEHGAVHMVVANLGLSNILIGQPLFEAQLFAIFPPDHPLLGKKSITPERIAGEPMMVMRHGFLTRHLFDKTVAAHSLRPRIVLESNSTQALGALAHDGHGVAIVSSSAQNISQMHNATPIKSNICQTSAEVSAVWNPKRYQPAKFTRFLEVLTETANERISACL